MKVHHRAWLVAALTAGLMLACSAENGGAPGGSTSQSKGSGLSGGASLQELMKKRGLSEADVTAALKTYTPSGKTDEYYLFASGGHGGNLIVIGVPSMRILKYVGVFTPEPWQGYGYGDESEKILKEGSRDGKMLTWGDMHHPALSETKGDYDGQYIFVNDKANPRIAVVSLKDFTTVQIVPSELIMSEHGATMVTPDTEYVIETSQYPAPLGGTYADTKEYNDKYRGAVIFHKFDREKGRIDTSKSWAMELPPYMQDLADSGKLASDGYVFINSINTERATGGNMEGNPPLESGASKNDMDYMHVINWKEAEQVALSGKTKTIAGIKVIPLDVVISENLLHFGHNLNPDAPVKVPPFTPVIFGTKQIANFTTHSLPQLGTLYMTLFAVGVLGVFGWHLVAGRKKAVREARTHAFGTAAL